MSVETDLVAVLQTQCARVYPVSAPVNTPRPFVTYEHLGGDPLRYLDGTAAAQRWPLLQVGVWASGAAEALALSQAIEGALCAAAAFSCDPVGAVRTASFDDVEPVLYRALQDYQILGVR